MNTWLCGPANTYIVFQHTIELVTIFNPFSNSIWRPSYFPSSPQFTMTYFPNLSTFPFQSKFKHLRVNKTIRRSVLTIKRFNNGWTERVALLIYEYAYIICIYIFFTYINYTKYKKNNLLNLLIDKKILKNKTRILPSKKKKAKEIRSSHKKIASSKKFYSILYLSPVQ